MTRITQMTKKEVCRNFAREYHSANKKRKGEILHHLCAVLGWSRDNARRQVKRAYCIQIAPEKAIRKKRPLKYSGQARDVLANAWAISGQASGLYLYSQIQNGLLERLIHHQELHLGFKNKGPLVGPGEPLLKEIKAMSPATIDRYLRKSKKDLEPSAKSTTRPSHLLRNEIPFGKSHAPHEEPGWLSVDTVAHCGESLKGEHIWTLNSTDTVTGWTETESIARRSAQAVKEAHEEILSRFPFPVLGINYDGGSEFINRIIIDFAALHKYQMTRSRPYHSNDNAHVEQKNADIVRRHAFRYRYEGKEAMDILNDLWYWVNLRKNFLFPTRKCIGHTKTKSGRTRGIYDQAKTPAARLMESTFICQNTKEYLKETLSSLNDAEITRRILQLQDKLLALAFSKQLLEYVGEQVGRVISA